MSLYNIFVVNTAPGCDTEVQQQVSVSGCTTYIVRLSQNSNALGPFDVYQGTSVFLSAATLVASAQTRTQMFNGIVVSFECVTPTPTPTPSATPPAETPTQTPTTTETPTPTTTSGITPTPTPTFTPTPSETPTIFEIQIFTQDGLELITQDGNPIILQQEVTSFLVSSGSIGCPDPATLTQTIYSSVSNWTSVVRFFSDANLSLPFNGGGLNYANQISCSDCWVIDNDGYTSNLNNPC